MRKNRRITKEDKELIIKSYNLGLTYGEITEKYGFASATIARYCGGLFTMSERSLNSRARGRNVLSDQGRLKLSECGKKACQRSGKYWTKPEIYFRDLLLEIGIGVRFPDYVKEIKKVEDDNISRLFCYQYPIQRYILDFVDIENKVAININGDYWHANPLLYDSNNLGKMQVINIRQDKNKRIFLEKNGWKVIDIWESEIYWNKDIVKDKIRAISLTEELRLYTAGAGVQLPHCPPDWSETLKKIWFKTDRLPKREREMVMITCPSCKKDFETAKKENKMRKYCCYECFCIGERKVIRPNKDELLLLINEMPMTHIGKKYGVSDNAVRKWAKRYGIL